MLIPGTYTDVTTIVHKDTPIQLGTGPDGAIHYSILLADPSDERGRWKDAGTLTFPTQCREPGSDAIKPFPTGVGPSGAPPRALSDGKYVYVFRVFTDNTIYVDRFVPDIVNALLNPTYDVRKREDGTYGYTDLDGNPYYEPTTRLPMLDKVYRGAFAALQVPTSRPGVNRWQFFLLFAGRSIRNVSIRCSPEGLFDLTDQTITYAPQDAKGNPQPLQKLTLPGVTNTIIDIGDVDVRTGLAAALFQKHDQVTLPSGTTKPMRTYVHVLLAFGTSANGGIAVLDFEVGKDGGLAIPDNPVPLPALGGPPWAMQSQKPDRRGLVILSGLLSFAQTADAPFILDSGDGFVHLYFRGLTNHYLVAFYDTLGGQWVNRESPLAAQVMNAGDWLGDGYKTAVQDSELLLFAPRGYVIWQYDPLVTGSRDGLRDPDQGFPGRSVVNGVHAEYFPDRRMTGPGDLPSIVTWLGDGRLLFIAQGGGYEVWQYDPTVVSGSRDGYRGQDFPGQIVVSGMHATYFGDHPGIANTTPAFTVALDQGRVLFMDAGGNYAVWTYDGSATGFRDGYSGQNFPGTLVVSGTGPGFFQQRPGGSWPPQCVVPLGSNRFLLLDYSGAYEVWQYDPMATGFRDGNRGVIVGFPGTLVVSGIGPGFFANRLASTQVGGAVQVGLNRLLVLDPNGDYEVWQYDPTATGFRDGTRGTIVGFPGTLIVGGRGPNFFSDGGSPGLVPAVMSFLGFTTIAGQPSVIEQGAIATDDSGALIQEKKGNLQGAMYRWYTSLSHSTAASAARIKVEDLDVALVGTNVVGASLVGYIEGPPPIPMENVPDGSGGVSPLLNRVTLTVADSSDNVWTWNRDAGIDMKAEMEAGGTGFGWKVTAKASVDTSYGFLDGTEASSSFAIVTSREVSVEGAAQNGAWVPYNYGIAYLLGVEAIVYALRLKGSERLVGYQQIVSSATPTLTQARFLINPYYTKQGTLDGMIGLQPDPDYPNAANAQGGNSYFKPDEAAAFADAIEREAKVREAFYSQYNANAFNSLSDNDRVGMTQRSLVSTYQWQAPGGLQAISEQVTNISQTSAGGSFSFLGMVGETAEYAPPAGVPGASFKESLMFGGHLHLTVKKTEQATTSFGLSVGVAIRNDVVDSPPGTRVQSYQFQTFYLAEDSAHFNDFFARVVDPAWLNRQKGDASMVDVFRGAMNRAKAVWRVVHRVTSIDRGEGS